VAFAGATSESREYDIGVPQGTLTGPQVFKWLFSDLLERLEADGYTVLCYADDLCLLVEYADHEAGAAELQRATDAVTSWAAEHNMELSPTKSVTCDFSASANTPHEPCVRVGGQFLPADSEPRFLGIHFDRALTFDGHFRKLAFRWRKRLAAVKRIADTNWEIKTRHLNALFTGLCSSISLFGLPVWSAHLQNKSEATLNAMKYAGAKVVLGLPRGTHTESALSEAGILPVELERKREQGVLVCRAAKRSAEDEFSGCLEKAPKWVKEGMDFVGACGIDPFLVENDFVPAEFVMDPANDIQGKIAQGKLKISSEDAQAAVGAAVDLGEIRPDPKADPEDDTTPKTDARKATLAEQVKNRLDEEKLLAVAKKALACGAPISPAAKKTRQPNADYPGAKTGKAEPNEGAIRIVVESDGAVRERTGAFAVVIDVEEFRDGGWVTRGERKVIAEKITDLKVDSFVAEQIGVGRALHEVVLIVRDEARGGANRLEYKVSTDPLSAILSLKSAGIRDRRELDMARSICELAELGVSGELAWERGHSGRERNEAADKEAKAALGDGAGVASASKAWPWHVARSALKGTARDLQTNTLKGLAAHSSRFLGPVTN
jgi:ribonuclease HI